MTQLTDSYRQLVCRALIGLNQHVVYAANSLTKKARAEVLENFQDQEYDLVFIVCNIDEKSLRSRLQARDNSDKGLLGWEKHFDTYKKGMLETPDKIECDNILVYDQENYNDILLAIQKLIG